MKITNTNIETLSPGGSSGVSGVQSNQAGASSVKASKTDSVNLSNASQLVNLAKAGASERPAKLASVAALVRNGQYSADTASVSQAVVQGHLQ